MKQPFSVNLKQPVKLHMQFGTQSPQVCLERLLRNGIPVSCVELDVNPALSLRRTSSPAIIIEQELAFMLAVLTII